MTRVGSRKKARAKARGGEGKHRTRVKGSEKPSFPKPRATTQYENPAGPARPPSRSEVAKKNLSRLGALAKAGLKRAGEEVSKKYKEGQTKEGRKKRRKTADQMMRSLNRASNMKW